MAERKIFSSTHHLPAHKGHHLKTMGSAHRFPSHHFTNPSPSRHRLTRFRQLPIARCIKQTNSGQLPTHCGLNLIDRFLKLITCGHIPIGSGHVSIHYGLVPIDRFFKQTTSGQVSTRCGPVLIGSGLVSTHCGQVQIGCFFSIQAAFSLILPAFAIF